MTKHLKIILAMVIGIICVFFIVSVGYFFFMGEKQTSKDISDYRNWKIPINSNLLIFPKNVDDSNVVEYSYYYQDTFLDPTYDIYLKCQLSEENYEKEIERLAALTVKYKGEIQKVKYEEQIYKYPAYVAIQNWDSCNEFALLDDDNNTIIYIYNAFLNQKKTREFMPENIKQEESYNIYAFQLDSNSYYYVPEEEID